MTRKNRYFTSFLSFLLIVSISLMNVNIAFADDDPTPESTTTETPVEVTDALVAETPTPEETPPPGEIPTEESAETSIEVTEASVVETPTSEETPFLEEVITEETAVSSILAELPADTKMIILDENGEMLPLASQEAVDIILEADPIWCPLGIAPIPNMGGCTADFATPALLLSFLQANQENALYQQAGVIYLESATVVNVPIFIDAALLPILKNFPLNIRGGWNNINSTPTGAITTFDNNNNAYLHVGSSANPWVGDVRISDIFIQDNRVDNAPSVQVYTTNGTVRLDNVDLDDIYNSDAINIVVSGNGNVVLNRVDISDGRDGNGITVTTNSGNISLADVDVTNQQDGYAANLQSQSGNITIRNGSSNGSTFDNGNDGLGFFASTNTGAITVTGESGDGNQVTFSDADGVEATQANGATLSAPTVTLTYITANNNDLNGIQISNADVITLNNIIATNNGTGVTGPDLGSGVRVFGTGLTIVNINGGTFSNNERFPIEISNGTANVIVNPTMTDNGEGNTIIVDNTPPEISPVINCSRPGNAGWCRKTITINWNVSDAESAVNTTNCRTILATNTGPAGTTLSCSATSTGGTTNASIVVFRDDTAPSIIATKSPATNELGWNNTDVTVTFTGTDADSGIASCSFPALVTAEGLNQSRTGTCTDIAGNTRSATENNINIDKTLPVIIGSRTPSPNANGWNNTNVTISFSGADSLSGIFNCTSPIVVSTDGANQSIIGTCTDRASNTASITVGNINIDKTGPLLTLPVDITAEATGPSDTVITFTPSAIDAVDGVRPVNCTPDSGSTFTIGTTLVNCSTSDSSGNTTNGKFNITVQDTIAPVLTLPTDIIAEATSASGFAVNYTVSANDIVDTSVLIVCDTASGSTFSMGKTLVTCTATDGAGNSTSDDFNVTVQDTTAPLINEMANIIAGTQNKSGAIVTYTTPSTLDGVDGTQTATCAPASGSLFPVGNTLVTCQATDSSGNNGIPVTFLVLIKYEPKPITLLPGFGEIIPVTGSELIDLSCPTILKAFGITIRFHGLCEHRATITKIKEEILPAQLPKGYTYVKGLNVTVLFDGQVVENLPKESGVQMDFPIPSGSLDQYVIFFWNDKNGAREWVEVTQTIKIDDLEKVISDDAEDGLYKIASTDTMKEFFQIITTEKTGTFVLVKK